MPNKLPKFLDNHKICIICEGNEEYEYLKRLKDLKVWNEQYDISLVNAGGNGNIPARYQDRYQNGADEVILILSMMKLLLDVEKLRIVVEAAQKRYISIAEGRMLYSLGVHTFEKLAKDSGARRVIGGRVLVNVQVLNEYIEAMFG